MPILKADKRKGADPRPHHQFVLIIGESVTRLRQLLFPSVNRSEHNTRDLQDRSLADAPGSEFWKNQSRKSQE